jgi:hypothetical protein
MMTETNFKDHRLWIIWESPDSHFHLLYLLYGQMKRGFLDEKIALVVADRLRMTRLARVAVH